VIVMSHKKIETGLMIGTALAGLIGAMVMAGGLYRPHVSRVAPTVSDAPSSLSAGPILQLPAATAELEHPVLTFIRSR
jgi:hypothetical protein